MKRTVFFTLILFVSGLAAKSQTSETRQLDNFTAISVGEAIKVTLIQGDKNEAIIEASNIDLEDIKTDIFNGKLKIELAGNRYRNIDVEIELTFKELEKIAISSAANVVTQGEIKAQELDISVSSAANGRLKLDAQSVDVDVSSSGQLELDGRSRSQRVGVSSAGEYDAYDLQTESAYVRASSAGSARVSASKEIDAKASSAGSIKYRGNPDKVYISSSSGGYTGKSNK